MDRYIIAYYQLLMRHMRNCSITRGDYAGAALVWMMAGKKGMRLA
jgi:hypothetical protein